MLSPPSIAFTYFVYLVDITFEASWPAFARLAMLDNEDHQRRYSWELAGLCGPQRATSLRPLRVHSGTTTMTAFHDGESALESGAGVSSDGMSLNEAASRRRDSSMQAIHHVIQRKGPEDGGHVSDEDGGEVKSNGLIRTAGQSSRDVDLSEFLVMILRILCRPNHKPQISNTMLARMSYESFKDLRSNSASGIRSSVRWRTRKIVLQMPIKRCAVSCFG